MDILWISHRGYKVSAVENTREAFRHAVALGFTALETDLRLSSDGHVVLHHDPHLARLAGIQQDVASMTRAELEAVRLPGDARLLFLDQFIREFPGCAWTFDVKPETGAATLRALHGWAKAEGKLDWLMAQARFVLWQKRHEVLLRELFPKAMCYAQERECWRAGLSIASRLPDLGGIREGRTYAVPSHLGPLAFYTRPVMESFHTRGARVLAFLPETPADAWAAAEAGADEILTNGQIQRGPPAKL